LQIANKKITKFGHSESMYTQPTPQRLIIIVIIIVIWDIGFHRQSLQWYSQHSFQILSWTGSQSTASPVDVRILLIEPRYIKYEILHVIYYNWLIWFIFRLNIFQELNCDQHHLAAHALLRHLFCQIKSGDLCTLMGFPKSIQIYQCHNDAGCVTVD
jgi:hypothetical protein